MMFAMITILHYKTEEYWRTPQYLVQYRNGSTEPVYIFLALMQNDLSRGIDHEQGRPTTPLRIGCDVFEVNMMMKQCFYN